MKVDIAMVHEERDVERERDVWNNREGLHSIMTLSKLRDMYGSIGFKPKR